MDVGDPCRSLTVALTPVASTCLTEWFSGRDRVLGDKHYKENLFAQSHQAVNAMP